MEISTVFVALGFLYTLAVAGVPQMWCVQPDVAKIKGRLNANCRNLAYYIEYQTQYFTDDTRVVFLPGIHRLSGVLAIADVSNLSLTCDWGKADIRCDEQGGVLFNRSENITIKNINLIACGANTSQHTGSPFGLAALYFEKVAAITIYNIGIVKSRGYGFIATQVCGQIIIQFSAFRNNIGGNARFSFKDCLAVTKTSLLIEHSEFLNGSTNLIKAGGASGLLIESSCLGMGILLNNVTTSGNKGGNVELKMEAHQWRIEVLNSTITSGSGLQGSGLHFLSKFSHNQQCYDNVSENGNSVNSMKIMDTIFSSNAAMILGGGLLAELYSTGEQSEVTLHNCTFRDNVVTGFYGHGAALKILRKSQQQSAFIFSCTLCQFCGNSVTHFGPNASVAEFEKLEMASLVDTSFSDNMGTAIAMTSSNVVFEGDIQFNNNRADYGGALRFRDSSAMFLNKETTVLFRNNHAYKVGGVIYAQEAYLDQPRACFFQPNVKDNALITDLSTHYHINLTFANNTAGITGGAIYGGKIDECYTYTMFVDGHGHSSRHFSSEVFNETFNFKGYKPGQISSHPIKVGFCRESEFLNEGVTIPMIPGQPFNISVVAVGQRFGNTPATISVDLVGDYQNSTIMQSRPVLQTSPSGCINLAVTLLTTLVGTNIGVVMKLHRDGPFSDQNSTVFNVLVQPCPWGFTMDIDTRKCGCSTLHDFNYQCDIESLSLTIKHDSGHLDWIGCENLTDCTNQPFLFARGCGRAKYCDNSYQNITSNSSEKLCADNRTGILCGACVAGHSIVLATWRCKSCPPSNKYLSLVVPYLAAGMLLVIVLTKLRLTINKGSLNGFIFYANFLHWNKDAFFPHFHNADILRLIVAWLNLDLGIEVCFFNGMTALHVIWLQIGYILYIVFLQVTIILLCRRYVMFTRFFGRNVTKVLSTLVTLLYAKTLVTVASVFTYTDINNGMFPNRTLRVFSLDGNIRFGSSQHVPLLVMASFLAVFLILFMFSLLFIQLLMQISSWRCFTWVARFQPFFETFTGPCNFSYAFWPGYLFFVRTGFLLSQLHFHQFNSSRNYAYQAGLIGAFTIILSILGPKGVYRKWSLNMLELSLILNLSVASFIVSGNGKVASSTVTISSHVSIALALLQFFTFHIGIHTRFNWIRSGIRLCIQYSKTLTTQYSQCGEQDLPPAITHTDVTVSTSEQTPLLPAAQGMPHVMKYEDFREPLVEN